MRNFLLILSCFLFTAQIAFAVADHPVINEIAYRGTEVSANDEWIELFNPSDEVFDLSGWTFLIGDKNVKLDGSIAPKGFFLLERTDDQTLPSIPASQIYTGALNDDGILLQLKNPSGAVVDELSKWYVSLKDRSTMARVDPSKSGDDPGNWVLAKGTPKRENMTVGADEVPRQSPHLQISRFLGNPKGKDEGIEWIELKNLSAFEANLLGWTLKNQQGEKTSALSGTIPPLQAKRFFSEDTGITLRNTGDLIALVSPQGTIIDQWEWNAELPDGLVMKREDLSLEPQDAYVLGVVDGDTIDVEIAGKKERVRLIGVDTPESVHPEKSPQPFSKEASDFTRFQLLGKKIRLEFDEEKRDDYGRLLAYVIIHGKNFNAELIEKGYARAFLKFSFRYWEEFKDLQEEAKENGVGIWKVESDKLTKTDLPTKADRLSFPSIREILREFGEILRLLLKTLHFSASPKEQSIENLLDRLNIVP